MAAVEVELAGASMRVVVSVVAAVALISSAAAALEEEAASAAIETVAPPLTAPNTVSGFKILYEYNTRP